VAISDEYLAGFIDGEGCLTIALNRKRGPDGELRYSSFRGVLVVSSNHRPVLDAILAHIGAGSIHEYVGRPEYQGRGWQYRLSGPKLGVLLVRLRPLLIVKAEQADVLLEFFGLGRARRDSVVKARQAELLEQIRGFNKKGRDAQAGRDWIRALDG
jgi:hypothetical protein